jgi:quinoprotein glucose dehydrogenase
MTSPPAIYRNVIICGSIVPDSEPQGPNGDVRGFDALTGKLVWRFHTVAQPREFGVTIGTATRPRAVVTPTCGPSLPLTPAGESHSCH